MKRIMTFIIMLVVIFAFSLIGVNADNNTTNIDGAYYKVEETLEDINLDYGLSSVNFKHEKAVTAVTDQKWIVGYECGGAVYSDKSFLLNKEYSQNAFILNIKKDSNVKIVVWSVIKNGHWNLSTILETAKDYELHHPGYKVLAGVNGDFFDISADDPYPYTVYGTMVADGETLKITDIEWPAISFKNDGSDIPWVKIDKHECEENPYLKIYDDDNNLLKSFPINKINEEAINDEIALFYGLYKIEGNNHLCNYVDVNNAFIVKDENAKTVPYDAKSFYGRGQITAYGADTLKDNNFALKTNNKEVLNYLKVGQNIEVEYELKGELKGANNVSGAVSTFLRDSKHQVLDNYDYMQYRFPRTLCGYTKDGDVVFAVTDGRQAAKGYYGLNGVESAAQMLHYGCVEACSFDGGGSSTMVILQDGELRCVNSPSDGNIRRDGNAVLIVARVPELKIDYKSKPNEITIMVEELEEISGYDEYYVKLNGQMLALVDGKAKFENLDSNSNYQYFIYIKKSDSYGQMPYSGEALTQKEMYEVNEIRLSKFDDDNYQLHLDLKDDEQAVITASFILGDNRISLRKGQYLVDKKIVDYLLSNSNDSYLIITYQLSLHDEREEIKYDLNSLSFDNASTALSTISDSISDILSSFFE